MRVNWQGVWLTDSPHDAFDVRVNGRRVVQEEHLIRALRKSFFARGGRSTMLAFSASRQFDTVRECEEFALSHEQSLAGSGTLTVRIGIGGEDPYDVFLHGAVLDSVDVDYEGCRAMAGYSFRAPQVSGITPAPPPDQADGLDGGPILAPDFDGPVDGGNTQDAHIPAFAFDAGGIS